jgi:hypothetical protein
VRLIKDNSGFLSEMYNGKKNPKAWVLGDSIKVAIKKAK